MAARVKVIKTKTSPDVKHMFNDMMSGNIKLNIVHKKYDLIRTAVERFIKVIDLISKNNSSDIILLYGVQIKEIYANEFYAPDLAPYLVGIAASYETIPSVVSEQYLKVYKEAKDGKMVRLLRTTLENMIKNRLSFYNRDGDKFTLKPYNDIKPSFLFRYDAPYAPIGGLLALDFKQWYIEETDPNQKQFILGVLQKILQICLDLYDATNIPDIDPDDFVEIVVTSVNALKKKIPRCNEAFAKILDSIHMLKDNFTSYYKSFVVTENPTIIIESFISDIAKQSGNNIKVAKQFQTIINHYKNLVQKQGKSNPKISKIFDAVGEQFSKLKSATGVNFDEPDADDDADEADDVADDDEEVVADDGDEEVVADDGDEEAVDDGDVDQLEHILSTLTTGNQLNVEYEPEE